jgi:hypothetical protein
LRREPERRDAAPQCRAGETEAARGACDVAAAGAQRRGEALRVGGLRIAAGPVPRQAALGGCANEARLERQLVLEYGVHVPCQRGPAGAADREALERILELAHVAGPRVPAQADPRLLADRRRRQREAPREALLDRAGEAREVARAGAQGRQAQARHVEAVVEIGAETPGGDLPAQVAVRGRDHPRRHAQRRAAADALVGALLEHAQQHRL